MDLFNYIRKATTARIINWKPTGKEVEINRGNKDLHRIVKGYETVVGGISVKTIIRPRKKTFSNQSEVAYGIVIEKNGQSIIFTDDPKTIPGEKEEFIITTVFHIQQEMEERNLAGMLRQTLANLLYG